MALQFTKATRSEAKARVALLGPTGAGKTWTALQWAHALADGGTVAVIDTENASASLYADQFPEFVTSPWWPPYDATKLAADIKEAAKQYDVIVLDSLTHFWAGDGGVLDIVDREGQKLRGNTYAAWKKGTPIWRSLLDALIFAPCHIVVTMRSKMDHVIVEKDGGRKTVEKLGMAPQARNDVEYEFTVVGELDQDHRLTITKSRASGLADAVAAPHQAGELAQRLVEWLAGADPSAATGPPPEPEPEHEGPTPAQTKKVMALFGQIGITDRNERLELTGLHAGREVASWSDLSKAEAAKVIDQLEVTAKDLAATPDAEVIDEPAA